MRRQVAEHCAGVEKRVFRGCAGGAQRGAGWFLRCQGPLLRSPLQKPRDPRFQTGCRAACQVSEARQGPPGGKGAPRKEGRVHKPGVKACCQGLNLLAATEVRCAAGGAEWRAQVQCLQGAASPRVAGCQGWRKERGRPELHGRRRTRVP